MLEVIKTLVEDKNEIVTEEVKTVKMFVPFSFKLVDGKCSDDATQELYDFLCERPDVIEELEEEEIVKEEEVILPQY